VTLLPQTEMRAMTVVPGGLDQHTAQVRVTGLGDRADAALASAGTLGGHEARVAHDFAGVVETTERAKLGGEGDGSELGDAAQRLESVDDGFAGGAGGPSEFIA
jgi:hypothetical protein